MKKLFALAVLTVALLFSCSRSPEAKIRCADEMALDREAASDAPSAGVAEPVQPLIPSEDSISANTMTSSAARTTGTDTTRRFIRTADLRFRVKNVLHASLAIEDLVAANGGFVTSTILRNQPEGVELIPISEDSVLEVSRFRVVNQLTVRVPNDRLDSTLRALGKWVDQFDHRTVTAVDVRLDLMRNAMAARRNQAHGARITQAIDDKGRKLKETTTAEETVLASEENADNARLANMELKDRIDFSTVQLDIYQRSATTRTTIANEHSVEGYRPSLFSRIGSALAHGWRLLCDIVVGLLNAWPVVVLIALFGWFIARRMRTPRKS